MISKLNFFFINNDIIAILYLVYTYKRFKMRFQKKLNAYLFSLVFPIKEKKKLWETIPRTPCKILVVIFPSIAQAI